MPTQLLSKHRPHRGFSIVEMLAVAAAIAVLVGILLPVLNAARRSALYGTSQSNLRQVGQYLALYAGDNREAIVPTAFDYRANLAPGKVRTASPVGVAPPIGPLSVGSWVDILWTENSLGPIATNDDTTPNPWNYRFDSPDAAYYALGGDAKNVFRSAEAMQAIPPGGGTGATPFGDGAFESEKQNPGYFGGNPFFDGRPPTTAHPYSGRFWVTGQIKRPSASMYCMDAWVGELLTVNEPNLSNTSDTLNLTGVEWRYSGGYALSLYLDGQVASVPEWDNLRELEQDLGVRVFDLDKQRFFPIE
jgi:prepilin-type N-terminal cleavage/methylation domain-containing protein